MTKTDWFMLIIALMLIGVCWLAVIQLVAPKDNITIQAQCDYVPQMWQVHACNDTGVCDDDYIRMTVEEANGACR